MAAFVPCTDALDRAALASCPLVPPPSGYIGLAFFYGGFNAPSAPEGALTLTLVAQIVFQFAGAVILTAVGLAFIFLSGFHRPLLELVQ